MVKPDGVQRGLVCLPRNSRFPHIFGRIPLPAALETTMDEPRRLLSSCSFRFSNRIGCGAR